MNLTNLDAQPVMLQHGLLDSSTTWLVNKKSLGYMLYDLGYDVWMTNNRGNKYGRDHESLNPDIDKKFWDFTYDEMAEYDVPSNLEFILKESSKYEKVVYIGHSQGTIQLFAALSSNPSLNDKIAQFHALGPVTTVSHQSVPLLDIIAQNDTFLYNIAKLAGQYEFLPNSSLIRTLAPTVCTQIPSGCNLILEALCGVSYDTNVHRIPIYTR